MHLDTGTISRSILMMSGLWHHQSVEQPGPKKLFGISALVWMRRVPSDINFIGYHFWNTRKSSLLHQNLNDLILTQPQKMLRMFCNSWSTPLSLWRKWRDQGLSRHTFHLNFCLRRCLTLARWEILYNGFGMISSTYVLTSHRFQVIYVGRNVKDAAVSRFYHRQMRGFVGTFPQLAELFKSGKQTYNPFFYHVLDAWQCKGHANVYFTMYEEMKRDLAKVICDMAAFLGKQLSDTQVNRILELVDIDTFRKNK